MADLLLELVSEEIPARMQAGACRDLSRMLKDALIEADLWNDDSTITALCAPRHLVAYATDIATIQPDKTIDKRGPRVDAPDAAIAGFLKSAGIERSDLIEEDTPKGRFFFARSNRAGVATTSLLPAMIGDILISFPWPKSQRWGTGKFRWVRPLHRINLLLDGVAVPGHLDCGGGLSIDFCSTSCGHHFDSPADIDLAGVTSLDALKARLAEGYVMLDQDARAAAITADARSLAASEGCKVDESQLGGYVHDIAGLVEWPTLLLGEIEARFMALPPELLQATIATHQKYITLTDANDDFSRHFIVVSNRRTAPTRDRVIMAGNQRVLRARLADAEFFWEQDKSRKLGSFLPALSNVTFHEGLGTMHDKAMRLAGLAAAIAPHVPGADVDIAALAAKLAKADLVTGMVGEFPELQGIMGGYYAEASGEDARVATAVSSHYRPQGPSDALPDSPEAMVVALADKLDTLVGFFGINAKPTGSRDPFALRRAALGVIRIIVDAGLTVPLAIPLNVAAKSYGFDAADTDLLPFVRDRLRGYLRDQNMRHDVVAAALADDDCDDVCLMAKRAEALAQFLAGENGVGLLAVWRRVSSMLAAEEKKAGSSFAVETDQALFNAIEKAVFDRLASIPDEMVGIGQQLMALGALREPIDVFFDKIIVNDDDVAIRHNRLGLLAMVRARMLAVADFTKLEG